MTNADGDNPPQSLLDPAVVRDILLNLQASDVEEFEAQQGKRRIYVRREPGSVGTALVQPRDLPGDASEGIPIHAPLTGIYYGRPSPDQPPYVSSGSHIIAGQVVGLIETMKLFNEVTSEVAGEVLEIIPRDGDLVE